MIFHGQGFFTDHGLHGHDIFPHGITGVQLIGNGTMIGTSHAFTNGGLHETGQGGQDVNGREDPLGMQLTIQINLSFGNVSRQIGNGMGNVIIGHGQNGQLRDTSIASHHTSGAFVNGTQIRVHVSGVSTTTGDFFTSGGNFAQGIGVRTHIGQNDQDVQITFVGQILGGRQGQPGRNDPFNGGIIGQIQKQGRTLHGPGFFKIRAKKARRFHIDPHGPKDNGKVFFVRIHGILLLDQGSLTSNLRRHFIVGQTGGGENGNLLSAGNRVHDINGGNARLNHGLGVITRTGIDGLSVNVQIGFGEYLGSLVNDFTTAIKGSTEHFFTDAHFQNITSKFTLGFAIVNAGRAFKDLDYGTRARHFQDLSLTQGAIAQLQIDNFRVFGQLDIIEKDERTIHTGNGAVFQTGHGRVILHHGHGVHLDTRRNETFFGSHDRESIKVE
mmetsp:Transcript_13236/g.27456  ORF Transcript_13236/g.27456 Transcript_13236/m.27456 type:complete len:441 (-) Transcript_13236:62-1384(-)